MTAVPEHANGTRPPLAVALNLLASARSHAARHSAAFGLCVVAADGSIVLLACEGEGRSGPATAAATHALGGGSDPTDESAGSVLPDLGPLGATVGGGIGIAAREPFARDILDGVLGDLRGHVERFLRQ